MCPTLRRWMKSPHQMSPAEGKTTGWTRLGSCRWLRAGTVADVSSRRTWTPPVERMDLIISFSGNRCCLVLWGPAMLCGERLAGRPEAEVFILLVFLFYEMLTGAKKRWWRSKQTATGETGKLRLKLDCHTFLDLTNKIAGFYLNSGF